MTKQKKIKAITRKADAQQASAELKDWHCIAIIVGLVAIYFRELLLNTAFLWEDFLYSSYPARSFAAVSMAMGQMPLWNPFSFSGMPFFADIINMVFYLPCTVLVFFVQDGRLDPYWLQLVVVLHYVLAGIGMFYLAKSFRLGRFAALFAGVAYMFTGFLVMRAIHLPVLSLAAWMPLIVLSFRSALRSEQWRWVFVAALVLGHSILAGFPQLSLYIYILLFALFLFELLSAHKGKDLLSRPATLMMTRAAAVVALSVGIAAVQLLPTIELSDLSQRAQITYEKSTEGSLAWSQLLTLVVPKLFGEAGANGYNYWGPGPYWHYWETCSYLGILPFLFMVLSLAQVRTNRSVLFFWGVALVGLMYALGNNFFLQKLLFDFVPGFSRFKTPARTSIFIAFAAALLSAFTIHHLLENAKTRSKRVMERSLLFGFVGAGVCVWLMVRADLLVGLLPFLREQASAAFVARETNLSLAMVVLSGAVVFLMLKANVSPRFTVGAAIALTSMDLYFFAGQQNTSKTNPSGYFHQADGLVSFIKNQSKSEYFRVNTRNAQGMLMDRNQGMVDRIFITEGYTPLALQRLHFPFASGSQVFDLLNVKYKTVTDEQARTLRLEQHTTYFPRAFFLYDIHVVGSEEELLAYVDSPSFDHRKTAVLEKTPERTLVPVAGTPAWNARITRYENNLIGYDVETEADGLLVLSEPYFPGWRAYVDGTETEIYRTDYNLRGLFVTKGEHHVEVRYRPESYLRGGWITMASLFLCGGGLISLVTRKKARLEEHTDVSP